MRLPRISKRTLAVWAGLPLIVLAVAGVSLCRDMAKERKREKRALVSLADCQDPLVFEDFIAKYPKSKSVDDVRRRYIELVGEQAAWEREVMTASRDGLKRFVAANRACGSHLLRLANARIDSMDWREATASASSGSMERYINEHPDGLFVSEAVERRNTYERIRVEEEERARRDTAGREEEEQDLPQIEYLGAGM